ncbi:uncharacterized protein K02A2.6-like [Macrosteles quadrilineatus]|uniref:uncharacterized protein K02A2.6-like n=1 Tax=Macrosteles quadrilineatus TaxID=74068 RepID=UPI0023E270A2|nr:uncharacterized protein K02A2.6-like [Macrosteles quadrilineatus]
MAIKTTSFIRGIHDSSIREQLIQTKDLTFDIAVEKAIAIEASKIDSATLNNFSSPQTSSQAEVNKLVTRPTHQNYTPRRTAYLNNRSNNRLNHPSTRRNKVDLATLGIGNLCLRCGKANHTSRECKTNISRLHCQSCDKDGHIAKVCISTLLSKKSRPTVNTISTTPNDSQDLNSLYGIGQLQILNVSDYNSSDTEKFFTTILINGKPQKFEVDSGAAHTLLPKAQFDRLNLPQNTIQNTNIRFRSYTNEVFQPLGLVNVQVEYNGRSSTQQLFVVPDMYSPLLGRTWIRQLGVHLNDLDTQRPKDTGTYVNLVSSDTDKLVTAVESKFPEIFSPEIGHIPNVTCSLKLRPQSKPVFFKPRPLPYALRDRVGHDLDKLEQDKIITKIESCDWGSPLVVVPKPDGTLRLCADFKVTVNPQLYDSHYPIPRIDETLHKLRNAKFFCTLDLFKAYLHIGVDEESACVQTISTHKGTYKVNRLSFGIKTAPSIFQKVMEQVLQDLPGFSSYFDDIIVYGSTLDECFNNRQCFNRCSSQISQNEKATEKTGLMNQIYWGRNCCISMLQMLCI